jgi:demethylmenaquinone methyltransferase/2-methoxy-6-polyprenyl-1,4-benzoquinol methylase
MNDSDDTDYGFERVAPQEKTERVGRVFSSVASRYDLMNDLMSLGVHRLWKRYAVHLARPRPDASILDLAGGTGDMAALFHPQLDERGRLVVSDINGDMLRAGRERLLDRGMTGIEYVQADAEALPFRDHSFDRVSIAFGLRNVTRKKRALRAMFASLRYSGAVIILEFSRVVLPLLDRLYHAYSFNLIPLLGKVIAGDADSYRYLVESIRVHPDQETLKAMLEDAGFSRVTYYNLSGGIVAVHIGYKL